MTSLKDVTLAEAGKFGSLNEFAFFDKVSPLTNRFNYISLTNH